MQGVRIFATAVVFALCAFFGAFVGVLTGSHVGLLVSAAAGVLVGAAGAYQVWRLPASHAAPLRPAPRRARSGGRRKRRR
jgi:uncharacterized membrane protein YfcA